MLTITKDSKGLDKLIKQLRAVSDAEVQVGWFEEHRYGEDNENLAMAQVAQWQEEGRRGTATSPPIPERPFMREGMRTAFKNGANKEDFHKVIKAVVQGESVLTAMKSITDNLEETMKKVMEAWDDPPNAAMTIAEKGFDDPLIHTRQLINNVTAKVSKSE